MGSPLLIQIEHYDQVRRNRNMPEAIIYSVDILYRGFAKHRKCFAS